MHNTWILNNCFYNGRFKGSAGRSETWWKNKNAKNNYHYKKMKLCNSLGVRLITIFEDEWLYRNAQVKQFLQATLGKFKRRIYARECKYVETNNIKNFFSINHIQGSPQTINFGMALIYGDEIVGAVSYARHHRNKDIIVLNRLAFKADIQIVGGASKLLTNSLKKLNCPIITWSDNRWSTGSIYEKCSFINDDELAPDYSYVIKQTRKSKQSMKKKNINCPHGMTEHEFCLSKGIYRIYDCGKIRWKYNP